MAKLDLTKQYPQLYKAPAKEPVLIDVPPFSFLMVSGAGDPNTSQRFKDAVGALFSVSYTLKFAVKKDPIGLDYKVMPLEGLWRLSTGPGFDPSKKATLIFTLMVRQPDVITDEIVNDAIQAVAKKKPNPALSSLRLETFAEGLCVQVLHTGSFDDEGPTMDRVHAYMNQHGLRQRADHHEIYLSDFTRTAPERLKTILRTPVDR